MTDAATLRALADRVEAGGWSLDKGLDRHLKRAGLLEQIGLVEPALAGDVNAALALREAVLGDQWTAVRLRSLQRMTRWAGEVSRLTRDGEENAVSAHAPTPARALLAATLRAKAAEMENE